MEDSFYLVKNDLIFMWISKLAKGYIPHCKVGMILITPVNTSQNLYPTKMR